MCANTSVNNWPKRYRIRFHVNKEPSPRRLREYIRLLYKSSCPHGPSTSKTYSCYFTNASHIPHFHTLPVTSTDIIWRDGQTPLGHSFGGYLHKFHSWYACDQYVIPREKCSCVFAFCGVEWRCLSLARSHVSVDTHTRAWLPNDRATVVIVKCSSKTPPLDPSSKRRMSAHRSIGYLNYNPKSLSESVVRLMYLRVYDNRDTSLQSPPSPFLDYSLTHPHRSIGYHNRNPKPLSESSTRLMYLRVYDNRDTSCHPTPSPSPCYPLTHAHRSIGHRNRNPQASDWIRHETNVFTCIWHPR